MALSSYHKPIAAKLLNVVGYTTGVEYNDKAFQNTFPYVATPHSGVGACGGYTPPTKRLTGLINPNGNGGIIGLATPKVVIGQNFPNPFVNATTLRYHLVESAHIGVNIFDLSGKLIKTIVETQKAPGDYEEHFDGANLPSGTFIAVLTVDGQLTQSIKMTHTR